jgi:hypothetical protein
LMERIQQLQQLLQTGISADDAERVRDELQRLTKLLDDKVRSERGLPTRADALSRLKERIEAERLAKEHKEEQQKENPQLRAEEEAENRVDEQQPAPPAPAPVDLFEGLGERDGRDGLGQDVSQSISDLLDKAIEESKKKKLN